MSQTVTILGCGSSGGVPRVAQGWGVCDPANPRNRRRRCSILVERTAETGTTQVLIDTSPDLREQLIGAGVERLDGILMTHPHADHLHGIDDVRPLVLHMHQKLDIYMDAATSAVVRASFSYIFETPEGSQYPPLLAEQRLHPGHACRIEGSGGAIEAMPFRLDHGEIEALGFRFGAIAYTPDFVKVLPGSWQHLEDLDLWIVDGLRYTPHPTHLSIGEALELIRMLRPKRAVLTNLSSEVDYETLRRELPPGVEPAYDGMRLEA
jgi:phosphoribosyl 1,2-cyclic phosphate phosphodiesterase